MTAQFLVWGSLVAGFCVVLIAITRIAPTATPVISVLIPAGLMLLGLLHFRDPRMGQLLLIESFYMAAASVAILAIMFGSPMLNQAAGLGFFVFFAIQIAAFLVDQVKKKTAMGFAQSILGGGAILLWGVSASLGSTIDEDGRFLMWGEDAPAAIQAIYVLWVVDVLVVARSLPKLTAVSAQAISTLIAVLSGQFFFARILTASQAIMFDGLIRYSDKAFVHPDFMTTDEVTLSRFRPFYRKYISPAVFVVICILVAVSSWESLHRLGAL